MNFHYQVSIFLLIIRVPPEITYEPYSDHISEEARNKLIIQINMNKGTPNQQSWSARNLFRDALRVPPNKE